MSEEAAKEAHRELNRMRRMPIQAAEYSVIKTYLDLMVSLPWQTATPDNLDIRHARQVLDEDHYGLAEIKERILEFLAVRKLRADRKTNTAITAPTTWAIRFAASARGSSSALSARLVWARRAWG